MCALEGKVFDFFEVKVVEHYTEILLVITFIFSTNHMHVSSINPAIILFLLNL